MPSIHFMSGGNIPFNDRVSCWILTQRDCYQNFNFVSRPNNFCYGLTGSFQNFIVENVKYCWGNKSLVRNFSFCGFFHNIGDFSRAVVTSIERPYFISVLFYGFFSVKSILPLTWRKIPFVSELSSEFWPKWDYYQIFNFVF